MTLNIKFSVDLLVALPHANPNDGFKMRHRFTQQTTCIDGCMYLG